jgi:hypothetical protein
MVRPSPLPPNWRAVLASACLQVRKKGQRWVWEGKEERKDEPERNEESRQNFLADADAGILDDEFDRDVRVSLFKLTEAKRDGACEKKETSAQLYIAFCERETAANQSAGDEERHTVLGELDSVTQRVRQHLSNAQSISEYQAIVERLNLLNELKPFTLGGDLEESGVVNDVGDGEGSLFKDEFSSFHFANVL